MKGYPLIILTALTRLLHFGKYCTLIRIPSSPLPNAIRTFKTLMKPQITVTYVSWPIPLKVKTIQLYHYRACPLPSQSKLSCSNGPWPTPRSRCRPRTSHGPPAAGTARPAASHDAPGPAVRGGQLGPGHRETQTHLLCTLRDGQAGDLRRQIGELHQHGSCDVSHLHHRVDRAAW